MGRSMRIQTRGTRAVVGLGIALALVATACGGGGTDDEGASQDQDRAAIPTEEVTDSGAVVFGPDDPPDPVPGGKAVLAIEAEPEALDPTRYAWSSSGHFIASAVFEPLATIDEEGQPEPYLAESITTPDEGFTWVITLRDGILFHDGSVLDADAVVANLAAARESLITGLTLLTVDTIEATGTNEVTVVLNEPNLSFPTLLTTQVGYVVEPGALADGTIGLAPVGTGPFRFEEHIPKESWSFTANEDYWRTDDDGNTLPYLDAIEFRPIPDDGARLDAFEAGDVDVILSAGADEVAKLSTSDFKRVTYDVGETSFILLNMEAAPFDNKTARQAVAYAADTERWIAEEMSGVFQPSNGPFAPGQLGYLEDSGFPVFDMEKATELVAAYEEETGQPLAFTYTTVDEPQNLATAQFFAALFEEAGMAVEVESFPQINLIAKVATGDYQMAAFRNFGFPNPATDTTFWRPSSIVEAGISLNFPRFSDPRMTEIIDEAVNTIDPERANELYQDLNRLLAEELPYIWLGRDRWALAAQPWINGVYAAQNGSIQTLGPKAWVGDIWIQR